MTSNPPDTCCVVGCRHEGTAKGEIKNIGDTPAYFSYTSDGSTKCGVLLLTDVMGHEFKNAQLIADQFAANGYFTVAPDLFQGDPVTLNKGPNFDVHEWMAGGSGKPSKYTKDVDPVVTKTIKEMRSLGVQRLGCVGYCFGAKYVVRFLGEVGSNNNAMVDAGFTAHPSFVEAEELRNITGPLSIAAAETDNIFPAEKRHETEKILEELSKSKLELPYEMTLYSGVDHGFAVRGDPKIPRVRFAKEKAFIQAVHFFQHHLDGGNLN